MSALLRRRLGIALAVVTLVAGIVSVLHGNGIPAAEARPINPYVPCPQWQELHPGWPCWGNFPEIEEPSPQLTPPSLATPQPSAPTTTPTQPPAAALTPPPAQPAPDACKAIIPVPGYVPPALPGHPPNAPCGSESPPNPRELVEPFIHPACGVPGLRILSPEEVHEVVTEIVGPLEAELGPDDPYVRDVIDRVNGLNKTCFGNKDQIKQQVWNETRAEWYRVYRDRFLRRDRNAQCDGKNRSKDCEGLVPVCYKNGEPVTPPITQQRDRYITGANDYIRHQGYPAIRIPVSGSKLGDDAGDAARRERQTNPGKYPVDPVQFPNGAVAGHVPDTTWSGPLPGKAEPYRWEAMDSKLNSSIGAQARTYPYGYRAIGFVPGTWGPSGCEPAEGPYDLATAPPYGG
ncbi:hypothetical protein ACWDSJ_28715 [Nocardia sp. NPDC003482]